MSNRNGRMLVLTAAVSLALAISGCSGQPVIPASYDTYQSSDGSFMIQYPAEWAAESGGKGGYAWAKFTSGSAKIAVDTSAAGSLVGNISGVGSAIAGIVGDSLGSQGQASVGMVHQREKHDFEEEAGVEEQAPVPVSTGFGDTRESEFTGTTSFSGLIHGYRTTALGLNYRFRVVCQCSEADWADLKPVFDKVIASLSRGKQE
jgi:hypothetical protein